ncbi:hypothetical protein RZE82_01785 [Mollicutes bacterium LVI A0039]|nr:hypothetical protein RZE82_01785 [Mollicutes bacterium LVI A0039]
MENPFEHKRKRTTNNTKEIAKLNKQADQHLDLAKTTTNDSTEDKTKHKKGKIFWLEMNEKYGDKYQQLLHILQKIDEYKWYIIVFTVTFTNLDYILIPCLIFIKELTRWFFEQFID